MGCDVGFNLHLYQIMLFQNRHGGGVLRSVAQARINFRRAAACPKRLPAAGQYHERLAGLPSASFDVLAAKLRADIFVKLAVD